MEITLISKMTMCSIGKYSIFAAACLFLSAVSCVNDDVTGPAQQEREGVKISVSNDENEAEARTLLNGLEVHWEEGDQVSVVALSLNYDADRIDYDHHVNADNISGSSADFVAFLMGDHEPAYMIYPGNESLVYDHDAKTITTTTQQTMTACLNTFPKGSNLAAGAIVDGKAQLKNLMSVFKFEITGTDIVEVNIEARGKEALAGDVVINAETLEITSITGWSSIRIVPEEGRTCLAPGVYCIPVPAGHYSKGIAFDLIDNQGFHAKKMKTGEFDLPAGKLIDLGKQSEWGIEIHVGLCTAGTLEYLGNNRFSLKGCQVRGKEFTLERTMFGLEYSLDKGVTWTSIEHGFLDSETVDMEFEVISPGNMLYRTYAKHLADDPVRSEEQIWRPGNLVTKFYWDTPEFVGGNLKYVGSDESHKNAFMAGFNGTSTLSRRTDKEYSGDNGWDPYQIQMMPGYWADMGFRYPGTYGNGASSTTWYSFGVQLFLGCTYMDMTVPAVQGCKLDRITIVFATQGRSLWLLSEPNNTLKLVGDYKGRLSADVIPEKAIQACPALADYKDYFYFEWKDLSTKPGASGVVTQENTPYYMHTYSNAKILYMEYEYIPVE